MSLSPGLSRKGHKSMLDTPYALCSYCLSFLLPKYGAFRRLGEVHFKFISVHEEAVFLRFDVFHFRCGVVDAHAIAKAYALFLRGDVDGVPFECCCGV